MQYQFTYQLTENDYYEFNRYHLREGASKSQFLMARVFMAVVFLLGFVGVAYVVMLTKSGVSPWIFIGAGVALGAAAFFLFPLFIEQTMRRSLSKLKKQGKLLETPVTLAFSEDRYAETVNGNTTEYRYAAIKQIGAGEGAVYLYTDAAAAHMVPKTAFQGPEERDAFIAFAREKSRKANAGEI